MLPRLTADFWVRAYLARLAQAGIPAFVVAHGDDTAGAVMVKLSTLNGRAKAQHRAYDPMTGTRHWFTLAEGPETEVDAAIARECGRDPDLWVIEIEDRAGRTLLDQPGLDE